MTGAVCRDLAVCVLPLLLRAAGFFATGFLGAGFLGAGFLGAGFVAAGRGRLVAPCLLGAFFSVEELAARDELVVVLEFRVGEDPRDAMQGRLTHTGDDRPEPTPLTPRTQWAKWSHPAVPSHCCPSTVTPLPSLTEPTATHPDGSVTSGGNVAIRA